MGLSRKGILSAIACLFFNVALSVFVASVMNNKICHLQLTDSTKVDNKKFLSNTNTFWLLLFQDNSRLSVFSVIASVLFYFTGNKMTTLISSVLVIIAHLVYVLVERNSKFEEVWEYILIALTGMSYLIWIQLTSAYNKTRKSLFSVSLIALCEIIRKLILINYTSPCDANYECSVSLSQTRTYVNFGVCVLLIGIACGILFAFNLNLEDAIFEDNKSNGSQIFNEEVKMRFVFDSDHVKTGLKIFFFCLVVFLSFYADKQTFVLEMQLLQDKILSYILYAIIFVLGILNDLPILKQYLLCIVLVINAVLGVALIFITSDANELTFSFPMVHLLMVKHVFIFMIIPLMMEKYKVKNLFNCSAIVFVAYAASSFLYYIMNLEIPAFVVAITACLGAGISFGFRLDNPDKQNIEAGVIDINTGLVS